MKKELKILIYSMINNLIISIIKIVSGLFYGLGSYLLMECILLVIL